MTRTVPYLSELQPAMFCEVSPELAEEVGLEHGGWATIYSTRAAIEARVLVTDRIPPIEVQGRKTHQIGLPYHWGTRGLTTGGAGNDLSSIALDPNAHIQAVSARGGDHVGRTCRSSSTRSAAARTPSAKARAARSRNRSGRHDGYRSLARDLRRRGEGACRLLHRHLGLHRLQGLRGRLQGVEPRPRGRNGLDGRVVRQPLGARR